MNKREIFDSIQKEYEQLQLVAKEKLERKKIFCYEKCPRIKEIDEQLQNTAIKISKTLIGANKENKQNYVNYIKKLTQDLTKEKDYILSKNGFNKDFFENIYICKKCKDTGYIDKKRCDCFKQKLIEKYYKMSNIMPKTPEKFPIENCSKEVTPPNTISPYQNMQHILKVSTDFVENFDKKFQNLLFYGDVGLGKTLLCNIIAKDILNKGHTVLYSSAFSLFEMFEKSKFKKDNIDNIDDYMLEFPKTADLLVIDDLGTEFITTLSTSELFDIINSRLLNKKHTIISTNLSSNSLSEIYSSRIISRIYGSYEVLRFFGEDVRLKKRDID